jgi:hypothetical protein
MAGSIEISRYIKERIKKIKSGQESKAEKAKFTAKFLNELKGIDEPEYDRLMNEYKSL